MDEAGRELVAPEEINPDERGRDIREQLGRMDLVVERPLREGHPGAATVARRLFR